MLTSPISFTEFFAGIRTKRAIAFCLFLCMLGLGVSANAQETAPPINPKDFVPDKLLKARHGSNPAARATPFSASAQQPAPTQDPKEVVLFDFVSPPRGAYPALGVIRDPKGNLYGTTNGAYSDVGGGGTNNAGVVFKIDTCGNQTVLYSFTGGVDGSSPNGLIRDSVGNLYGTTNGGGAGYGVVFRLDPSGNQRVLYSFTGGADGANPNNVILDWKGNLYGTATGGGVGYGVVFKIDTTGKETTLYTFTGGNDGAYPNFNVTLDSFGNLYGTTNNGGAAPGGSGFGVVFKVDSSGHETVLYTFTGGSDGAYPNGVILDFKGNLYGTASGGGGPSGAGVVYKVDPSGNETVLYTFTGGNDGNSPSAAVSRDLAGNLYSTTAFGGANGLGVVFKLDPSGHETVLHTFMRGLDGDQPDQAGVVLDLFGNLYGTAGFQGAGGQGVAYKIDASGNYTVLYAFPGAAEGQYPAGIGVILGSDGKLYGATFYGGRKGHGVVYQLNLGGNQKVLYNFDINTANGFGQPESGVIRDRDGNLYGATFIGQADVYYGFGVVYKVDPAGNATVLHNFTNGNDGAYPSGVVRDSQGNLYGVASNGASGYGLVFKIDPSGNETVLYNFTGGNDGAYPIGVILDSKGNLYGTTNNGGAAPGGSGFGVVFKVDSSGHETVLYTFTGGSDGAYPNGLILDSKGNLYGTAFGGGAGYGVVFSLDPSDHETVLYTFAGGADGGYPGSDVVLDSAGNLFGTTGGGGAGYGVVFRLDPSNYETVLHTFTGGNDGAYPSGVILGPDGKLYGTTAFGGRTDAGVVFKVEPK